MSLSVDSVAQLETAETSEKPTRFLRCVDWLQKQNSQDPKKLSLQNKNDIQFIIQTNADRKNFLLSAAEDEATVPPGIDEPAVEPKVVPLRKLRTDHLRMECEWQSCKWFSYDYEAFQIHVRDHMADLHVIEDEDGRVDYVCLWDICGHKTADYEEMTRHMNYHAYHSRLLAIGFNGRATLKLARCKKDSGKRNHLPELKSDRCCMWTGCTEKFNSIQAFFDHIRVHIYYSDNNMCSWAGCGATYPRRLLLTVHVRSHTSERIIACYHCGVHFSCNRKLCDHLRRQNVHPNTSYTCSICNSAHATKYLLNEHQRQHVSAVACALCDMSAPTAAALAQHVRYRHFTSPSARQHACPQCEYRAVTRSDLRKHVDRHTKKQLKIKANTSDQETSDAENSKAPLKKNISTRKYACHMCPEKEMKVFSRGTRLTTHLVKVHDAQWSFGHSRFRYQISEDGMYRLTTTRYEYEDVSKKIEDGYIWPKEFITNSFEFNLELKAEPTDSTPRKFEVTLRNSDDKADESKDPESLDKTVEITMCDVDEDGNILNSEVINSDVVYT